MLAKKKHDPAAAAQEVHTLIAAKVAILDGHGDHYKLLGVSSEASDNDVRKVYFNLARQLHPDRLAALDIEDDQRQAQRVFAQINAAFATLSDPKKRAEYTDIQRRGGEAAIRAEQAKAEAAMQRALDAEEAFRRAEIALKRDQAPLAIQELQRAIQLDPDAADYHAMLAWAQFVVAPEKNSVGGATRRTLERAIERAPQSITPRFFLGRVERILGRDQDALRHFRDVLSLEPRHAEAAGEVRALESRLGAGKRR
ncbi:MAG: DnaJ domain-containing protein [Deltaproteobacteria bacterium]|nr:DnaJ domain-containing protein [Deltaproteobacteria bacterium]